MYNLQQEAPTAVAVLAEGNGRQSPQPDHYSGEYHGPISHHASNRLLLANGQYLVRECGRNPKQLTLSLRFNEEVKHYRYGSALFTKNNCLTLNIIFSMLPELTEF